MADLIEDAIVDAKELRKAAEADARSDILDEHHKELKEREKEILENKEKELLGEQDDFEDELGDEDEFDLEDEEFGFEGDDSGLEDQVPDAAAEGEDLCPCPDDNGEEGEAEKIEIDFDELAQQVDGEASEPEEGHEEAAEDVVDNEEGMLEEEEPVEEEFEIDMEPTKSGTTERPEKELDREMDKNHPDEDEEESEFEPEGEEISDNSDVRKLDEVAELKGKIQVLQNKLQNLKEGHESLKEERDRYRSKLLQKNEELKEVNTERAKFFYQNRVLESRSLNEQQKRKLAEALSNADSAKEAETIYEHVTKAVESETGTSPRENPGTLEEAVSNMSPKTLKAPSTEKKKSRGRGLINENEKNRMKEMAGIPSKEE